MGPAGRATSGEAAPVALRVPPAAPDSPPGDRGRPGGLRDRFADPGSRVRWDRQFPAHPDLAGSRRRSIVGSARPVFRVGPNAARGFSGSGFAAARRQAAARHRARGWSPRELCREVRVRRPEHRPVRTAETNWGSATAVTAWAGRPPRLAVAWDRVATGSPPRAPGQGCATDWSTSRPPPLPRWPAGQRPTRGHTPHESS